MVNSSNYETKFTLSRATGDASERSGRGRGIATRAEIMNRLPAALMRASGGCVMEQQRKTILSF
jgi:hypothetical protein